MTVFIRGMLAVAAERAVRFSLRLILVTSLLAGGLWAAPALAQPPQIPTDGDEPSVPPSEAPPEERPPSDELPPEGGPPPAGEAPGEQSPPPEFTVRGTARLAWDQAVASYDEAADLAFQIYVDASPQPLDGVSCSRTVGPSGVECQAPLPRLAPGRHTIWMSASSAEPARSEGPSSSPIVVRVLDADGSLAAVAAPTEPSSPAPVTPSSPSVLTTGLDDPTDLAVLPDGSVLIAERAGRIRRFRDGHGLRTTDARLPDLVTGDGHGLLSLAVDRDFAATHAVFALYSTESGLRTARFVLADGVLAQQAIVLDDLPAAAAQPRARLRMAPDRTLYIALDHGGTVDRADDLGSLSGKVLRINQDGTTPADQPAGPPVHLAGVQRPTGLVWLGDPHTLWVTDNVAGGLSQLLQGPADPAWPRAARARFALPEAMGSTTAAAVAAIAAGQTESLIVAGTSTTAGLLRIRIGPAGEVVATAWIALDGIDGPVLALAVGADGALYACTARALVRVDMTGR